MSEPDERRPAGRVPAPTTSPYSHAPGAAPTGPPVSVLGRRPAPRRGTRRRHCGPPRRTRWRRRRAGRRRGMGGRRRRRRAGARPASATSPSWSRPAPRCRSSRTPSSGAGIPFRAESSSLVYASRAVRDLLMVLRAVDDPTDHLHVVSALRTPLLGCGDDDLFRFKVERGGRWGYLADQPDTVPADDPVGVALALPAPPLRRAALAGPVGAARPDRPRPAGLRARLRRGPAPRRLAPAALRDRPGPGVERGHRRQPAPVPALGRPPGRRRGPRGRGRPARDRRRRRAHHDHPQRQGPRVPDHHRVGHVDRPEGRAAAGRGGVPAHWPGWATGSAAHVTTDEFDAWAPIDEQMGLARADPPAVRGVHPGPRPPGRLAAPQGSQRGTRHGGRPRTNAELLVDGMGDRPSPTCPTPPGAVRSRPPTACHRRRRLRRSRRGRRPQRALDAARPAPGGGGHRADRRRGTGRGPDAEDGLSRPDIPGSEKRPRDLDLPPWLRAATAPPWDGPCTGCSRRSTWPPARASTPPCPPSAKPRRCPTAPDDVRRCVRAALGSPWCGPRPQPAALARGLRLRPPRRTPARGLHRSPLPHAPTAWSWWTTRRPPPPIPTSSTAGSRATAIRGPPTPWPCGHHRRAGGRVTFLFLTPQGAIARRLDGLDEAVAHVRHLVATGGDVTLP